MYKTSWEHLLLLQRKKRIETPRSHNQNWKIQRNLCPIFLCWPHYIAKNSWKICVLWNRQNSVRDVGLSYWKSLWKRRKVPQILLTSSTNRWLSQDLLAGNSKSDANNWNLPIFKQLKSRDFSFFACGAHLFMDLYQIMNFTPIMNPKMEK